MPYETQPGTIPHRVVEHIKMLGAGAEVSGPELADKLDLDPNGLTPCLEAPCRRGALRRRKAPSRSSARMVWWYSLGDGSPEIGPADNELDKPLNSPAPITVRPGPWLPATGARLDAIVDEVPFEAWLSTRGTLRLHGVPQTADGMVMLTPEQTAQVKRLITWSAV